MCRNEFWHILFFVLFKRSRGSCPLLLCLASPEGQGEGELRSERRDTPFALLSTASIHAKEHCQFVLHPYSTDHVAYIVGKKGTQFERNTVVDKEPFFSLSSLLLLTKASVPTRERVNGLRHSHGRLATQPITLCSLPPSRYGLDPLNLLKLFHIHPSPCIFGHSADSLQSLIQSIQSEAI